MILNTLLKQKRPTPLAPHNMSYVLFFSNYNKDDSQLSFTEHLLRTKHSAVHFMCVFSSDLQRSLQSLLEPF